LVKFISKINNNVIFSKFLSEKSTLCGTKQECGRCSARLFLNYGGRDEKIINFYCDDCDRINSFCGNNDL
jgi:hypothetical protein